jgi:LacI family transcriptional regulator
MKANGLRPAAEVEAVDFTFAAGREAGAELLAGLSGPSGKARSGGLGGAGSANGRLDAVIAANDLLAVGIMHELAARDLVVPADVAVIGMDDSELAEQCFPPLTSVNLGSAERGRRAAELLLARIDDDTRTPRRIVVQPTLSVRRSTP